MIGHYHKLCDYDPTYHVYMSCTYICNVRSMEVCSKIIHTFIFLCIRTLIKTVNLLLRIRGDYNSLTTDIFSLAKCPSTLHQLSYQM